MKKFVLLLIPNLLFGQFNTELFIPPILEGTTFELTIDESTRQFLAGQTTQTIGFNGDFLGPTLIFNQGDAIDITVNNDLNEPTTVHWHGMHVSPEDDGGPHTVIAAGAAWTPDFTVLDRATTFWYHPHLHEHTNEHVTKGASGMIIIRSDAETALTLPRTYGVDDIPLIVQTKNFDNTNQLDRGGDDDTPMVNGIFDPYIEVGAQMIRFRVLNGSNERVMNFGFSDNRSFYQIGSDGGLLTAHVSLTRVRLAPGERAELVVDFGQDNGTTLEMLSYASELGQGIPGGNGPETLDGTDFEFLEIRVGAPTANAVTNISMNLATHTPWLEGDADITRTITMDGGGMGNPFTLNQASYNANIINETVTLDNIEIWEITNTTGSAHPFHIHDVQFYILDKDGVTPPVNEQGLKDVVLVERNSTVRFITKFEDFTDTEVPYMYHCHILNHEDGGMMGQFLVLEEEEALGMENIRSKFRVYPNPVTDKIIRVLMPDQLDPQSTVGFTILDLAGKEISHFPSSVCGPTNLKVLYLEEYNPGIYTLAIRVNGRYESNLRMIIE